MGTSWRRKKIITIRRKYNVWVNYEEALQGDVHSLQ